MKKSLPKDAAALLAGIQGANAPDFGDVRIRSRGRLPHWELESGLYFVTFRLGDSLPKETLEGIKERARVLLAWQRFGRKLSPGEENIVARYSPRKIEEYLAAGRGGCYLQDHRVATLVADALRFWDGQRYRLLAWCLMPNHVHVVFRALGEWALDEILKSWKSYTARMANRVLGRSGTFWQREYYDHLIRDAGELQRAVDYVKNNPLKVGLTAWEWVWIGCVDVDVPTTAGLETGATPPCR
jgi:REP element-mobilizing transposase RayT